MRTNEHEYDTDGRLDTSLGHFSDRTYVCEGCGNVTTFDGQTVRIRSPFDDSDGGCAIHQMHLQNAEAYWDGEIEPDEVVTDA